MSVVGFAYAYAGAFSVIAVSEMSVVGFAYAYAGATTLVTGVDLMRNSPCTSKLAIHCLDEFYLVYVLPMNVYCWTHNVTIAVLVMWHAGNIREFIGKHQIKVFVSCSFACFTALVYLVYFLELLATFRQPAISIIPGMTFSLFGVSGVLMWCCCCIAEALTALPLQMLVFLFVDVLSMSTFTVYVSYLVDEWCKEVGTVMLYIGWLLTLCFMISFSWPVTQKDQLKSRLLYASRTSIVMDLCGKMFTYYLVFKHQERHIPAWVVFLELPTTLIEAMVKWEHTKFSRMYTQHERRDHVNPNDGNVDAVRPLLTHEDKDPEAAAA